MDRLFWGGGWVQRVLVMSAPVAVAGAAGSWARGNGNNWPGALVPLVLVGLGSGGAATWYLAKLWPGNLAFDAADRVAVASAVWRGLPIADARLAPAVRAFAAGVERNRWVLLIRCSYLLSPVWIVGEFLTGVTNDEDWSIAGGYLWRAVACVLALVLFKRTERNAKRADDHARGQMEAEVDRRG